MLKTVQLYKFKSHPQTRFSFDDSRLHALVGPNSSGKTSVLQALHYLTRLAGKDNSSFADIFQHESSPEFLTRIGEDSMSVIATGFWKVPQSIWQAGYVWKQKINSPWSPKLWLNGVGKKDSFPLEGWESSLREAPFSIIQVLRDSVYLKLVAANLAKAAYSDVVRPQMGFDGSGFAPNLDYLRSEAPDKFQSLQEMLQRVVPGVKKLGVRRAKVTLDRQRLIEVDGKSISYEQSQEVVGQEVVLDTNSGHRIPAHAISEGTMLALGLLAVLMNPTPPNLVLLDDIEQGLHPKAQRELMSVFKEIIEANPNLQIIFSTHSPYIVDELTPSQVHVLSNSKSGLSYAKRLDEHPDIEWAKQTLTTGEFWDAEGEDWVVVGEENG
jgi:predicted ATPase